MGKILVPSETDWVNEFVEEICGFTGVKDLRDDNVDALAALWRLLAMGLGATAAHDLNVGLKKAAQVSRAQQIRSAFQR